MSVEHYLKLIMILNAGAVKLNTVAKSSSAADIGRHVQNWFNNARDLEGRNNRNPGVANNVPNNGNLQN